MGAQSSILLRPACPHRHDHDVRQLLNLVAGSIGARWAELELRLDGGSTERYRNGAPAGDCATLHLAADGFDAVLRLGVDRDPEPLLAEMAAFMLKQLLHCRRFSEQMSLLRGALDTTSSAVLLFDSSGGIVYANPPADRLLSRQTELGLVVEGDAQRGVPLIGFLCSKAEQAVSASTTADPWTGVLTLSDGSLLACEVVRVASGGAVSGTGVLALLQPVPAASELCLDSFCARHRLSRRERDVVRLLLDGMATAAIADRLGISLHTVRDHVKRMYRKIGVRSRSELVSVLASAGAPPSHQADRQLPGR